MGEAEIAKAMRDIFDHHRMVIEGAAGVAVAGFRKLAAEYHDKTTAIILCGANINRPTMVKVLAV